MKLSNQISNERNTTMAEGEGKEKVFVVADVIGNNSGNKE